MNLDYFYNSHTNVYSAYNAAKWLLKNSKSPELSQELSQDIQEFEDHLNKNYESKWDKCPRCKIKLFHAAYSVECSNCGLIKPKLLLKNYNKFTDSYQEPTKPMFDQEKHFTNWINNILGISEPKAKESIIQRLKKHCEKNDIKLITIESLRGILKQLKLSKYYKYTSYLYKELTGVSLPFIPRDVINKAKIHFNNFCKAREKLVLEGKLRKNNPQYSYLIYKIFDLILKDEKRQILEFIHLPSERTLLKRNQEWELVQMLLYKNETKNGNSFL